MPRLALRRCLVAFPERSCRAPRRALAAPTQLPAAQRLGPARVGPAGSGSAAQLRRRFRWGNFDSSASGDPDSRPGEEGPSHAFPVAVADLGLRPQPAEGGRQPPLSAPTGGGG